MPYEPSFPVPPTLSLEPLLDAPQSLLRAVERDRARFCAFESIALRDGIPADILSHLTPAQLREVLIMLANYAGYPRAAGLIGIVEQQIAAVANEQKQKADG